MNRLYIVYHPAFDHLAAINRLRQRKLAASSEIAPFLVVPVTPENARSIVMSLVTLLVNDRLTPSSRAAVLDSMQQVT